MKIKLELSRYRTEFMLFALMATATTLPVSPARAQSGTDKVVATVNGDPVMYSEFVERLQRVKVQDFIISTTPLQVRNANAGQLTMETLINERLVLQWGTRTKDLPSDAEVTEEVASQKQRNPQIAALLANGSMTENQLRTEIKVQLTRFNIATVSVSVTPQDLEDYYKKNPQVFTIPEKWGLSVIRTKTLAKSNAAIADLKKGIPFPLVVKSYSEDTNTKDREGNLGTVNATDPGIPALAKTEIQKLKVGEFTPPTLIELEDPQTKKKNPFYFIFRLTSKDPAQKQPFDVIQGQLKRSLALQKAGGMQVADKKINEFRQTANIEINLPGYADLIPKK